MTYASPVNSFHNKRDHHQQKSILIRNSHYDLYAYACMTLTHLSPADWEIPIQHIPVAQLHHLPALIHFRAEIRKLLLRILIDWDFIVFEQLRRKRYVSHAVVDCPVHLLGGYISPVPHCFVTRKGKRRPKFFNEN